MIIWRFRDPYNNLYAYAGRRGTWSDPEKGPQERISPLIIEWEPGSDVIGNFIWPGFDSDIAIVESVAKELEKSFKGFKWGPVEMIQNKKLKKPQKKRKSTKPRVWLPYEGPKLYDLLVEKFVHLDYSRSSVSIKSIDPETKEKRHEIEGIEKYETCWNEDKTKRIERHTPRTPGKGLYIREKDLGSADIFGIAETPAWIFCTDKAKKFIVEKGFNNVGFLEMGETF